MRRVQEGFSRTFRLRERAHFLHLFENPRVYRTKELRIYWKNNEKGLARLGISVKGAPNSVWRIRLKRLVREWFRKRKQEFGSKDLNVVVLVPKCPEIGFLDLLSIELGKAERMCFI